MAAPVVQVEGARELRASMRAAGRDLGDLADANQRVAGYVAAAATTAAPHRSGSLAATVRGNRAASSAVVKAGGSAVRYAGAVHWGWPARHITAQPFLADTAARTEQTWTGIYFEAVQRIVDRIHGK